MRTIWKLATSKTVIGAVLAAGSWLVAQPTIGVIEVAQAVGTVISVVGARQAIERREQPHQPAPADR